MQPPSSLPQLWTSRGELNLVGTLSDKCDEIFLLFIPLSCGFVTCVLTRTNPLAHFPFWAPTMSGDGLSGGVKARRRNSGDAIFIAPAPNQGISISTSTSTSTSTITTSVLSPVEFSYSPLPSVSPVPAPCLGHVLRAAGSLVRLCHCRSAHSLNGIMGEARARENSAFSGSYDEGERERRCQKMGGI
jgi:hypothetical protein